MLLSECRGRIQSMVRLDIYNLFYAIVIICFCSVFIVPFCFLSWVMADFILNKCEEN